MIFFWEGCRPELFPPELLPFRPGVLDGLAEAEAASTTWLVVTTLLKVLLPLIEIIVVTTAWVLLLWGAVVVDSIVDGAPEVADCELKVNDDCVSELKMKDVDCASPNEVLLPAAANDDVVVCTDADEGLDAAADCVSLAEGEEEAVADADADAEGPVLRGTFCRYRRRPSMSRPAERLDKSKGRRNAHSPKCGIMPVRARRSTMKHRIPKAV